MPPLRCAVPDPLIITDLGKLSYDDAYALQTRAVEGVIARRATRPGIGFLLLVEHEPPVITISKRAAAAGHLLATADQLAAAGIQLRDTDRGGDITYHGPGQLVAYPMIDLNHVHLGLHDYMRLLEQAVIETCAEFGIAAGRDAAATGVWVDVAKICAMGVRVRKWVTMHGLALNVTTNLDHFGLIVPCGLAQREVTSMQRLLGQYCPAMSAVKRVLSDRLTTLLQAAASAAEEKRTLSSSHGAA